MVYYGPWEQGPDYVRETARNALLGRSGSASYQMLGAAPWDDEMNAALNSGTPMSDGGSGLGGSLQVVQTNGIPGGINFTIQQAEGASAWTAEDIRDVTYYYNAVLLPMKPPTARGIEFEANDSTPVRVVVHVTILHSSGDSTIPSGSNIQPKVTLQVALHGGQSYGNMPLTLTEFLAPTSAEFDFDLTSVMGPAGECSIAATVKKLADWAYYDPMRAGLIGAGISVPTDLNATRAIYTLHPPRHRWTYDTPPAPPPATGLPPLRQHPRRDGLGASTARRHYPPDRSVQASNRRAGGFY